MSDESQRAAEQTEKAEKSGREETPAESKGQSAAEPAEKEEK